MFLIIFTIWIIDILLIVVTIHTFMKSKKYERIEIKIKNEPNTIHRNIFNHNYNNI